MPPPLVSESPLIVAGFAVSVLADKVVSMQFGGKAREMLDLVTDYELLEEALPNRGACAGRC